jgi:hypothetical protein
MDTVSWTDEKIDALAEEVHDGFVRAEVEYARTDERFKRVDERFDAVDRRFDGVDRRFDRVEGDMKDGFARMDSKFDALQRTIIQIGGGLIGTLIIGIVTLIVAVAT